MEFKRCSQNDLNKWFLDNEAKLREVWATNLRFRLQFVPRATQNPDAAPDYVAEWDHPVFESLFVRWTTRGVTDINAQAVRDTFLTRMNLHAKGVKNREPAKKQLLTIQLALKDFLNRGIVGVLVEESAANQVFVPVLPSVEDDVRPSSPKRHKSTESPPTNQSTFRAQSSSPTTQSAVLQVQTSSMPKPFEAEVKVEEDESPNVSPLTYSNQPSTSYSTQSVPNELDFLNEAQRIVYNALNRRLDFEYGFTNWQCVKALIESDFDVNEAFSELEFFKEDHYYSAKDDDKLRYMKVQVVRIGKTLVAALEEIKELYGNDESDSDEQQQAAIE